MDDLKDLLGDELYTQVKAKLNGQKIIFDTGDLVPKRDWIPKTVFAEKEQRWKEQLEERTTEMTSVKEQLKAAEGQPEKLAEIQKKMTETETRFKEKDKLNKTELEKALKGHAVELALKDAQCLHSELLVSKVSFDSVVEIDGKMVVPEAVILALKEKYKENFGKTVVQGDPSHPDPDPDPENRSSKNLTELNKQLAIAHEKPDVLATVKLKRMITEIENQRKK